MLPLRKSFLTLATACGLSCPARPVLCSRRTAAVADRGKKSKILKSMPTKNGQDSSSVYTKN